MGYFCINFYSGFFIIIMPTNKQIVIFLNIKNKKEWKYTMKQPKCF
jgi:hypothetical protein